MISFYPGPSKVYPMVEQYLQDAFHSGILSVNHRSDVFMAMLKETIQTLKQKLDIPYNYEVYFVSSATECWEIIAQSLITYSSLHVYNGAFGEKWLEYTKKIRPAAKGHSFGLNEIPFVESLGIHPDDEVICITHNETSNGTALPSSFISQLRSYSNKIIAVDATSSMAGVVFNWTDADIWYASVQKCFGLPAGMGVMVVSPAAVAKAERVGDNSYYNSFLFTRENYLKYQTPYTPNALGIYLLGRVMEHVAPVKQVAAEIKERAADLYSFLSDNGYELLVENDGVRSDTVIAVSATREKVTQVKSKAKLSGLQLGNGYGKWKESSFRIANFPAITETEISILKNFLYTITG